MRCGTTLETVPGGLSWGASSFELFCDYTACPPHPSQSPRRGGALRPWWFIDARRKHSTQAGVPPAQGKHEARGGQRAFSAALSRGQRAWGPRLLLHASPTAPSPDPCHGDSWPHHSLWLQKRQPAVPSAHPLRYGLVGLLPPSVLHRRNPAVTLGAASHHLTSPLASPKQLPALVNTSPRHPTQAVCLSPGSTLTTPMTLTKVGKR